MRIRPIPGQSEFGGRSDLRTFTISTLIPIGCYALLFGYIHSRWVQIQDGSTISLLIHLGTACGIACGGIIILVLVLLFWSRGSFDQYWAFLLPVVTLALWLSSLIGGSWVFLYLVLLNTVERLVYLFIILSPFLVRTHFPVLYTCALAYLSFAAGKILRNLLVRLMPMDTFMIGSVVFLIVLLSCWIVSALLEQRHREHGLGDIRSPVSSDESVVSNSINKLQKATHYVTEKYCLTKREGEILLLLARGRTARLISEQLTISPKTAKTHLRRIYTKMGVHSQQELISIIEETIRQQRSVTSGKQ
jgi:DNA-binding CsgD family transcriptional regulator